MLLDNQLQIWESSTGSSRMCGNVAEVNSFLNEIIHYQLSEIESLAIDSVMSSLLPFNRHSFCAADRHLIVTTDGKHIGKWYEDSEEEKPEGMRELGIVFAGAYSSIANSVARFFLGGDSHPFSIRLWRRLGEESMPFNIARQLWRQQVEHILSPRVPDVMADLVPFNEAYANAEESSAPGFTINIQKDSFQVKSKSEMTFLLETLTGTDLSPQLDNILTCLFAHLDSFPKKMVSSPVVTLYCDKKGVLYSGGDGTNNGRKLFFCGKIYPQFFTGLAGNVFMLRLGMFENIMTDIFVMRN